MADIQAKGKPLAQVTTGNLEALRLYSMAIDTRISGNFSEARRLLDLAINKIHSSPWPIRRAPLSASVPATMRVPVGTLRWQRAIASG